MHRKYLDIMTRKNFRQFRLQTWRYFIGQFVYPVGAMEDEV